MLTLVSCSKKDSGRESHGSLNPYMLGIEAYKEGRYHEAVRYYEKAIEFEPENGDIYLSLAVIYDDCLNNPYWEQRKQDKMKAVEYYAEFISKSTDSLKTERAKEWMSICKEELVAMDAGVAPENLSAKDAIDREKALESLKEATEDIIEKYSARLNAIESLQSEVSNLKNENRELTSKIAQTEPGRNPVSFFSWILVAVLTIVAAALAWVLRTTPRTTQEPSPHDVPAKPLVHEEKILGSFIWVESVHNRGVMAISKDEKGIFVETRAINTSAVSSGYGKYKDNILEALLKDEGGEGALMKFEFYEEGRAFVASWEDELGHGSAVGLRNEFDEIVRPEAEEKDSNA